MTSKFNPNVKKRTVREIFARTLQSIALLCYTFFYKRKHNMFTILIGIVMIVSLYQLIFFGII